MSQLQSTFQLLQHPMSTVPPRLPSFPLHPILPTSPCSPATSACRRPPAPRPTPTTSRSCRLRSSACSTAAAAQQQDPKGQSPPSSRNPTAAWARRSPRTHLAKPWPALQLRRRASAAPRPDGCRWRRLTEPPSPLQTSTSTARACRKLWTRSFRADRL